MVGNNTPKLGGARGGDLLATLAESLSDVGAAPKKADDGGDLVDHSPTGPAGEVAADVVRKKVKEAGRRKFITYETADVWSTKLSKLGGNALKGAIASIAVDLKSGILSDAMKDRCPGIQTIENLKAVVRAAMAVSEKVAYRIKKQLEESGVSLDEWEAEPTEPTPLEGPTEDSVDEGPKRPSKENLEQANQDIRDIKNRRNGGETYEMIIHRIGKQISRLRRGGEPSDEGKYAGYEIEDYQALLRLLGELREVERPNEEVIGARIAKLSGLKKTDHATFQGRLHTIAVLAGEKVDDGYDDEKISRIVDRFYPGYAVPEDFVTLYTALESKKKRGPERPNEGAIQTKVTELIKLNKARRRSVMRTIRRISETEGDPNQGDIKIRNKHYPGYHIPDDFKTLYDALKKALEGGVLNEDGESMLSEKGDELLEMKKNSPESYTLLINLIRLAVAHSKDRNAVVLSEEESQLINEHLKDYDAADLIKILDQIDESQTSVFFEEVLQKRYKELYDDLKDTVQIEAGDLDDVVTKLETLKKAATLLISEEDSMTYVAQIDLAIEYENAKYKFYNEAVEADDLAEKIQGIRDMKKWGDPLIGGKGKGTDLENHALDALLSALEELAETRDEAAEDADLTPTEAVGEGSEEALSTDDVVRTESDTEKPDVGESGTIESEGWDKRPFQGLEELISDSAEHQEVLRRVQEIFLGDYGNDHGVKMAKKWVQEQIREQVEGSESERRARQAAFKLILIDNDPSESPVEALFAYANNYNHTK